MRDGKNSSTIIVRDFHTTLSVTEKNNYTEDQIGNKRSDNTVTGLNRYLLNIPPQQQNNVHSSQAHMEHPPG